jgi:hypothetical protein
MVVSLHIFAAHSSAKKIVLIFKFALHTSQESEPEPHNFTLWAQALYILQMRLRNTAANGEGFVNEP